MLYSLLKIYCSVTLKFYFKKWQLNGIENIPDGPVIFVPNHQNAFLDAVLVACSSKKNPYSITRSDVFKSSLAKTILSKLKMLPVYRFRDGYSTLKNNQSVISGCVNKLNGGSSLLIFAEGNHGDKLQLRPLQKGFARIAFLTEHKANVSVVPAGIHYEKSGTFRSRVLISFGKAISVNEIKQKNNNDENLFNSELLNVIKNELIPLILHIEDPDYDLKYNFVAKNRSTFTDLHKQLAHDQKLIVDYPKTPESINTKAATNSLLKIIGYYSKLNLGLAAFFVNQLILKKVEDPQFTNSIKYAAGSFIVPVFVIVQSILIGLMSNSAFVTVGYLFSVVISVKLSEPQL